MHSTASLPRSDRSAWLTLARVLQIALICLTVGLFIASVPLNYAQRSVLCEAEPCPPGVLSPASVQTLAGVGLSVEGLVWITIFQDILVAIVYTACAVFILIRKPKDPIAIFVTIMLVTFGATTITGGIKGVVVRLPELGLVVTTLEAFGAFSLVAFLFVFPSGRFIPRGSAAFLAAWFLLLLPHFYFPGSVIDLSRTNPVLYEMFLFAGIVSGAGAQIYRYQQVSALIERQQTKWVVYGLAIGFGAFCVAWILSWTLDAPLGKDIATSLALNIFSRICLLLLPLSIGVAVLRFRLWDINPIINRTLVYGVLSAATIAFYVFAVGFFSNYFQSRSASFLVSFLATGMIAFLFEPMRERLQRGVNRLMYGERDDPATVLTRLSQRLETVLAPDSVLQTIVETIGQTLRLPYAAITVLSRDEEPRTIAKYGLPPAELVHLPLTYQTERVGELILAPRAAGDSFSPIDMKLINIIAHQAGIAAYTVRLNDDLQQSRLRLVTAQEEERRRLRRDLHDGVGPTLASLSQRLETAADLVHTDPQASVELLKNLKGEVKNTVADIRRLVYALRPPVLDEFGLVSAIREHVAPYTGPNGLQVTFDVTESMPSLPAAVEVAAYRIALEAFTNIINHAQAGQCEIRIRLNGNFLLLEVSDNGKGLAARNHAGVGLTSMRERAAELGGECVIESIPGSGTRVNAWLPIGKE